MKMKKTKVTAVLMIITLIGTMLLSGCGAKKEEEPDTIKWFNASFAILTEINGQDYTVYCGMKDSELDKLRVTAALEQSWGITDRQGAEEMQEWLMSEGHRTDFVEWGQYMEEAGIEDIPEEDWNEVLQEALEMDETETEFWIDMYKMYKEYGEHAIDAWDYCRALNLLCFYYAADLYTKEEALDASLEIAKEMQSIYGSWDELIDSYLRGYEYWSEESSDERRAIYEDLKSRDDNPFAIDYNIILEKTW